MLASIVQRLFSGGRDWGSACGADASASGFILLFDLFSVSSLKVFGEPEIPLGDSSLIMS